MKFILSSIPLTTIKVLLLTLSITLWSDQAFSIQQQPSTTLPLKIINVDSTKCVQALINTDISKFMSLLNSHPLINTDPSLAKDIISEFVDGLGLQSSEIYSTIVRQELVKHFKLQPFSWMHQRDEKFEINREVEDGGFLFSKSHGQKMMGYYYDGKVQIEFIQKDGYLNHKWKDHMKNLLLKDSSEMEVVAQNIYNRFKSILSISSGPNYENASPEDRYNQGLYSMRVEGLSKKDKQTRNFLQHIENGPEIRKDFMIKLMASLLPLNIMQEINIAEKGSKGRNVGGYLAAIQVPIIILPFLDGGISVVIAGVTYIAGSTLPHLQAEHGYNWDKINYLGTYARIKSKAYQWILKSKMRRFLKSKEFLNLTGHSGLAQNQYIKSTDRLNTLRERIAQTSNLKSASDVSQLVTNLFAQLSILQNERSVIDPESNKILIDMAQNLNKNKPIDSMVLNNILHHRIEKLTFVKRELELSISLFTPLIEIHTTTRSEIDPNNSLLFNSRMQFQTIYHTAEDFLQTTNAEMAQINRFIGSIVSLSSQSMSQLNNKTSEMLGRQLKELGALINDTQMK